MIKVYMDGASIHQMRNCNRDVVSGFTTNPSLMRGLGVDDYEAYCRDALEAAGNLPVSLEVFADDGSEMWRQALIIDKWGDNAVVKIPITNTKGESTAQLVRSLAHEGVKVNVTAVFTLDQVGALIDVVGRHNNQIIVSVFAGRIADTGRDPELLMIESKNLMGRYHMLLWASTRELFNREQAVRSGCDIITMSPEQIDKGSMLYGRDLKQYSRETVQMFHDDAVKAGYKL